MEQQPGRRQPGRTGHGRPAAGDGRPAGNRSSRPPEDYVEDDPTMVRPFVKASSGGNAENGGGRRGRQGADGGVPGGRPRQGAPGGGQGSGPGGGQGRQQPAGRQQAVGRPPEGGRGTANGRAPQNGRGRPNGSGQGQGGVPGPRPPRDGNTQQVPGLLSTPMPAPRAVAGQRRAENLAPYPELDPPLSDLTATMPILAVPSDDGYDDRYDNGHADGYDDRYDDGYDEAAPGEPGHYHDDADFGRHRGGNRPPRALKIGAMLAGVAVVGVAAYSVLGGGSGSSSGPAAAGASTTGAAGAPSDSGSSSAPNAPGPTGTPTDSSSGGSTETSTSPSHTTKTSTKPTTTSRSSSPSTSPTTSRPSSAPSTTTAPPPAPQPSSASPTFTSLQQGSNGPAVKQLQQNLISLGYGWGVIANGNFDSATRNAVIQFQNDNPGTAQSDGRGVYGAATDKAMQQAVG